jgi:uncharacterized membrane protein
MSFRFYNSLVVLLAIILSFSITPIFGVDKGGLTVDTQHSIAYAQSETTYEFMQPLGLPGFGGDDGQITISQSSFAEYVNTLIQVAIGFAILLSVIMVIAGGVEYMGARSVTNKDDAKDRISKAIGGLVLALSAVVILQTINPNLVELKALEEVSVQGDDFQAGVGGTINPDGTGVYYCFEADRDVGTAEYDNVCAESMSQCENIANNGGYSVESSCGMTLYYNGGETSTHESDQSPITDSSYCFAYKFGGQNRVRCYKDEDSCEESPTADQDERLLSCRTPSEFDDGTESSIVLTEEYLEPYVLDSEESVRSDLTQSDVSIKNNPVCDEVGQQNCTNVGGLSEAAVNGIVGFRNDVCESSQCGEDTVTVTGGTSWWLHGDRSLDPQENGETHHNPTGVEGVNTGAVDIRKNVTVNSYIKENWGGNNESTSGCIGNTYFLDEETHWHIVFDDSDKCGT